MENAISYNIVKKYFDYLVTEFGYKFRRQSEEPEGSIAEFFSKTTIINIQIDRDICSVAIRPASHPDGISINIDWIVKYSTNEDIYLPISPAFPVTDDSIDYILQTYSRLLKIYCLDLLIGDFSRWGSIVIYVVEKMKSDYRESTGIELSPESYKRLQKYIDDFSSKQSEQ